jgi:hypothetical protein
VREAESGENAPRAEQEGRGRDETRDDGGKREGATRDAVGACEEFVLDRSNPDEGGF